MRLTKLVYNVNRSSANTHTQWDAGWYGLKEGVNITERKTVTGRVEWDRLLATNRCLILAH